ncbi:WD40 repeat domain-containing protein [Gemmata sp. JC717]|uniref:WD40 repeat domain-containing protein n=1 Tax=Gemmata algarum TaxID=2975278 RepID=UPI0021BA440A|nr:WD40 repeat domain-containing protein [Gemmata algarum]MDY3557346.1 WD40 repeat domain-containing protein [Gemmata algarum]
MSGSVLWLVLAGGVMHAPPPAPALLHEVRFVANKDIPLSCAAFFPDGKTVVFGGGDFMGPGRLLFWDVATGKALHAHAKHTFAITSVAVSPDGKRVATGSGHGEVKVWDPRGQVLEALNGLAENTDTVAFSPDGKWLAHTGESLVVRDTTTFERVRDATKDKIFGPYAAFSPDGKWVVGGLPSGDLRFLGVPGWKETTYATKVPDQGYYQPRYSPDGKSLIVHTMIRKKDKDNTYVYTVEVWSVSGNELGKKRFEVSGNHGGTAFTPDGKYVLLGEMDLTRKNRVRVWDLGAGREVVSWVASAGCIRDLVVSPDGNLLVSCADDCMGKVWDLKKLLGKK